MDIRRMRTRVAGAAVVVLALALAACDPGDDGSGESRTLRIAASGLDSLPFVAVLSVAESKGWFEEEGLEVSFVTGSGGGGNILRLVTTGEADLANPGATAAVQAATRPEQNVSIVGTFFPVNDFYWITPDQDAALEGARLGFSSAGSSTELMTNAIVAAMPDAGIETIAVGSPGANWAAAVAGEITAGWAMHPFVTDKQTNEGARVLVAARDVIGDFPAGVIVVNEPYLEANGENIEAFWRVADRAFEYVRTDTDAAAQDLAPLLNVDAELLAQGLRDTPEMDKAYSIGIYPDTLEAISELMLSTGEIDEPVDWSSLLDQQYLPEDARATLP
ncbi:MAG: ABC transporter substrate-binding protein [Micromonosporaceae bacterium]|nr:ABC transporter substrate-binding protein [Micromonosporaceae bacterium]